MPRRRLRNTRYKGLARGFYSAELGPWEREYDPSQMLVLQYEACTLRPAEQLAATYRFLGLDDTFEPPGLQAAVNKTKVKREIDDGFTRMLVMLYEPDVVDLVSRHPEIDLNLWPHFAFLADAR
jgi:Sulfotransferase domain